MIWISLIILFSIKLYGYFQFVKFISAKYSVWPNPFVVSILKVVFALGLNYSFVQFGEKLGLFDSFGIFKIIIGIGFFRFSIWLCIAYYFFKINLDDRRAYVIAGLGLLVSCLLDLLFLLAYAVIPGIQLNWC